MTLLLNCRFFWWSMSKIIQRLLVFFIGIPFILAIVFLEPFGLNHLPLNIVLIFCSIISTVELHKLFSVKMKLLPLPLLAILSASLPLSAYLFVIFEKNINYLNWIILCSSMFIMAVEVFLYKEFSESNGRIAGSVFVVFYSGFLCTFITRMTLLPHSTLFISLFLLLVFANDSLAWVFGMLFGKNNRGLIFASPNKSIAGFIGGFLGTVAVCVVIQHIFSDVFTGSFLKGIILAVLCTASAIIGDLVESVFKRSAEMKDSGNIILGRGGLLDSMDSILFTAPVFYGAVLVLWHLL